MREEGKREYRKGDEKGNEAVSKKGEDSPNMKEGMREGRKRMEEEDKRTEGEDKKVEEHEWRRDEIFLRC